MRGGEEGSIAGKFEVKREEDGLHVGQDGGECEKPHFDKMRDDALVRDAVERCVEGGEARVEEVAKVFEDCNGRTLLDAALDVGPSTVSSSPVKWIWKYLRDQTVEVFHWQA